jgi:hypothetical protein
MFWTTEAIWRDLEERTMRWYSVYCFELYIELYMRTDVMHASAVARL